MLRVVTVSTVAERRNAELLAQLVRREWPRIDGSADDTVTIAAGIKLVREGDLLVTFDLSRPRETGHGAVQAGAIVVEAKWLDASRFDAVGNDLRPTYGRAPSNESVLGQLKAQVDGITSLLERYERERCFVHGIVWLLGMTTAELRVAAPNASPLILACDATWSQMLQAAAWENRVIAALCGMQRRAVTSNGAPAG